MRPSRSSKIVLPITARDSDFLVSPIFSKSLSEKQKGACEPTAVRFHLPAGAASPSSAGVP